MILLFLHILMACSNGAVASMSSKHTDGDIVQPVIYSSDCVVLAIVTVPPDMTLTAVSAAVGLLGTGPATDVTSTNGNNDSLALVLRLLVHLIAWSPQFKGPPLSLSGPFLIARSIQHEFVGIYSVAAVVSGLLIRAVRSNEAVHWPFFQFATGNTILLLPWDPGLSLQGASIHHQLTCSGILICLCPPNLSILMLSELHVQYSSCRQPLPATFPWYIAWLVVESSCAESDFGVSENLSHKWMMFGFVEELDSMLFFLSSLECITLQLSRDALHVQQAENACQSLQPARPPATCDIGALLMTLGWQDVLPCGFLIVQPFPTMVQVVSLCPNDVSLAKFAIPRMDYTMMMNRCTHFYAWMLLSDSFLQAGISSYFKGNSGPCGFELLPWKFAWTLVLELSPVCSGSSGNYSALS